MLWQIIAASGLSRKWERGRYHKRSDQHSDDLLRKQNKGHQGNALSVLTHKLTGLLFSFHIYTIFQSLCFYSICYLVIINCKPRRPRTLSVFFHTISPAQFLIGRYTINIWASKWITLLTQEPNTLSSISHFFKMYQKTQEKMSKIFSCHFLGPFSRVWAKVLVHRLRT